MNLNSIYITVEKYKELNKGLTPPPAQDTRILKCCQRQNPCFELLTSFSTCNQPGGIQRIS